MPRKIKISYIIDDLSIAGAQVHLVRLVKGLHPEFDIEIISLDSISDRLALQLPQDVKLKRFQMDSVRSHYFFISFFQLISHLRKRKPDIVHTYLNTSNVFGLLAARFSGIKKKIISRRDMGIFQTSRMAKIEALLSRYMAQKVFCVCEAAAKDINKFNYISESKIVIIFNGVDTKIFTPKKFYTTNDKVRFGVVATMNRIEKGHFDFLKAAYLLTYKHHQKAEFWLVGDGPLRQKLEEMTMELNLMENVKFLGLQTNLKPILKKLDVLVVPSYSEGISNAALEGMAVGLPIIATAVDGNIELIDPETTGLLVSPKNPESLANAFLKYIMKNELIKKHGMNARGRVEKLFTIETMIRAYREEYYKLITGS